MKNQQNDCVAAQLLVTFFRPPNDSCRRREATSRGCERGGARYWFARHGLCVWMEGFRLQGWYEYKFASAVPHRLSVCIVSEVRNFRALRFPTRQSSDVRMRRCKGSPV